MSQLEQATAKRTEVLQLCEQLRTALVPLRLQREPKKLKAAQDKLRAAERDQRDLTKLVEELRQKEQAEARQREQQDRATRQTRKQQRMKLAQSLLADEGEKLRQATARYAALHAIANGKLTTEVESLPAVFRDGWSARVAKAMEDV